MAIDFSDVSALLEGWEEFDGDDVSDFIQDWADRLNKLAKRQRAL